MFCRKCGEENPNNAVYCRNCGEKLIEEVKKPEIIETPNSNNTHQTTGSNSDSSSDSWIGCCCLGAIVIFILSAIFSGI